MSLSALHAYADQHPGMIVTTRAKVIDGEVHGLCASGYINGAKPGFVVRGTPYAEVIDQAAANALSYWEVTDRASGLRAGVI